MRSRPGLVAGMGRRPERRGRAISHLAANNAKKSERQPQEEGRGDSEGVAGAAGSARSPSPCAHVLRDLPCLEARTPAEDNRQSDGNISTCFVASVRRVGKAFVDFRDQRAPLPSAPRAGQGCALSTLPSPPALTSFQVDFVIELVNPRLVTSF